MIRFLKKMKILKNINYFEKIKHFSKFLDYFCSNINEYQPIAKFIINKPIYC
jgi:hypothetical protein